MPEIELKFVIDRPTARAMWRRARALELADAAPGAKKLRSVYLDTEEKALRAAGLSLRLRRNGGDWTQTVKAARSLHGGLSRAGETESRIAGDKPAVEAIADDAIRTAVARCVDDGRLRPVCETVIRRRAGTLSLSDGTRAELAVDVGDIRAAERSAVLCEAEIELVEGDPARLFDLAKALLPRGGINFSTLSKCERGHLLAQHGYIEPPAAPRKAGQPAIERRHGAAEAARLILRDCTEQITANVTALRRCDDPEGPHQLRIGLRRLRTALSLLSPVLPAGEEADCLKAEARWLGAAVGRLRDLDVAANDIVGAEATRHPGEPSLAALAALFAAAAAETRADLRRRLAEERAQAFLIDLVRFVETARGTGGATKRPVKKIAGAALDKRWKKVRKHARGLAELNAEGKHALRKELKKLRYSAEFLMPLYGAERAGPFLKRLKKLQDVFGELNDAATIRSLSDAFEARLATIDHGERAMGEVLGATRARADLRWREAKALWRKLEKTRPFWQ